MILVVMGVCGAGKSTVGRELAARLGCAYVEGDEFHPPANVAKMRAGIPLDDDDRRPWLQALGRRIAEWNAAGTPAVVACSALKRAYRDILGIDGRRVRLVHLKGSRALIADRLSHRREHYMPANLLDSQIAALEEPGSDEMVIEADIAATPQRIVEDILRRLAHPGCAVGAAAAGSDRSATFLPSTPDSSQ